VGDVPTWLSRRHLRCARTTGSGSAARDSLGLVYITVIIGITGRGQAGSGLTCWFVLSEVGRFSVNLASRVLDQKAAGAGAQRLNDVPVVIKGREDQHVHVRKVGSLGDLAG